MTERQESEQRVTGIGEAARLDPSAGRGLMAHSQDRPEPQSQISSPQGSSEQHDGPIVAAIAHPRA
jgi:hypothetical protein